MLFRLLILALFFGSYSIASAAGPCAGVYTGGTGICYANGYIGVQSGAILYGNGSGALATTSTATNGQILGWLNGIPTPVSTTTLNIGGNAATVTTNANLTGAVTSVGNSTSYNSILGNTLGGTGVNSSAFTGLAGINSGVWYAIATSSAVNLNISGNAATVTTNANLTGIVTSVGNATSCATCLTTTLAKGSFLVGNDAGTAQATSSVFISSIGQFGVGSTSPFGILSVSNSSSTLSSVPVFVVASSTRDTATTTLFKIDNVGDITVSGAGTGGTFTTISSPAGGIKLSPFVSTIYLGSVGAVGLRASNNFALGSNGLLTWTNGSNNFFSSTLDTGLARNGVGVLEVNNGAAGTLRDLTMRSASTSGQTVLATAGGNVGVGTTSPYALLSVFGGGTYAGQASSVLFSVGSTTGGLATSTLMIVDSKAHTYKGGPTPTLSAGTFMGVTNDQVGFIKTASGAGTTLTMTFNQPWDSYPICTANFATSTNAIAASTTPTTVVFAYPSVNNVVFGYHCFGSKL